MKPLIALSLALLLLSTASTANGQFPDYPVRTLHRLVADHDTESNKKADFVVSAQPFPSKTIVVFTGERRPLDKSKLDYIALWFETRGKARDESKAFEAEYQLKEGDAIYWLPVEKQLEPFMQKELRKGDLIELYFFFMGGYSKSSRQWVFAVEEFRKL